MAERPDVVLVGARGAGKTVVGRVVAARSDRDFVDTDGLLGERAGRPAGDHLAAVGEAAFRALEEDVTTAALAAITAAAPRVLALGGGAVLSARVRGLLAAPERRVAFLDAAPEVLAGRLAADPTHRPALTDLPPEAEIRRVLAARRRWYEAVADAVVPATDDVEAVARRVLTMLGLDGR